MQYHCVFSKRENYREELPIMYINLDHRTDRKNQIEKELNEMGLSFERFPAIKDSFGAVGCSKSHLEVLKVAKGRKYKQILILEDDFTFLVDRPTFDKTISDIIQKQFDVCMISYNVNKSIDHSDPIWKKAIDVQTTSGYIVKDHYFDTLIKMIEESIPPLQKTRNREQFAIDMYYKNGQRDGNWYHTTTRLGKQIDSYSDIEQQHVKYGV